MQTSPADDPKELVPTTPVPAGTLPPPSPLPRGRAPSVPLPVGRAWTLPADRSCASRARELVAETLAETDASRADIGDAQLMVSELATNAHQHAPDHGPHELWIYPGSSGEALCAVFDRYVTDRLPGYSWTSGDYGRGLSIVGELAEGHWGMVRALSRCSPGILGKVVWFAVPGEIPLSAHLLRPESPFEPTH